MTNTQHPIRLNRLNDIFSKYLLGSEERKNYTLNFLNTTLDLSDEDMFSDLTFADKEKIPQLPDGKPTILDILATTNTSTKINIEVQVCKDRYMAERALYYWSRVYGSQLQKKESYDKLNKVISIILMEKIHYSDIKKLNRSDRWIAYLAKKTSDHDRKELTEMDSILKDVAESEDKFVSNLQLWRQYEAKEKAIKDEQSHLLTARLDGIEEGIAKGRAEGRIEGKAENQQATAQRLLQLGLDCKIVAAGTGLSLEEVEVLSKGLKP